ncbi:MAG: NUDIX hydrolase [Flavobacteriales bacterium]|jgi:8-oxo-dGTP pyrophosphatase MutT (NUDIX family)|nr:NUDIX hydrolase [Flavobacteriales bacterium]MBT6745435.1 NUDIX hydrolase [Flavobacteriales bacterium]
MDEQKNPWTTLSSQIVLDNSWIKVYHHDVLNPNGNEGVYGMVHFKNLAIGIIPIDKDLTTYLVGQYRFPLKQYSWEIPEGGGDLSCRPIDSAKRELLEETGIRAENYQEIVKMHLSNSVSDEKAHVYIATGLTFHEPSPEETEELVIKKVTLSEAFKMIVNGEITDSMSVAGLLKVQLLQVQGKLKV